MTKTPTKVFSAYPYQPRTIGETTNIAIEELRKSGTYEITTWEELGISGNIIIQKILKQIDDSELLWIDLTGLNYNAMFELGYGIAKNKHIFPLLDSSLVESKSNFEQLKILSTMGYNPYVNSTQIITSFYKQVAEATDKATFFEQAIEPNLQLDTQDRLLYLKSRIETDASVQITRRIDKSPIDVIIDDPNEIPFQYLTWYGTNIFSSVGVVCHFLNPEREGALLHNAKYALIAGMAVGMDKKLLMLSEGNILAPLDYREMFIQYQTAKEAVRTVNEWINPIETTWFEQKSKLNSHVETLKLANQLQSLRVGEPIAENEVGNLVDYYFIETKGYQEARDGLHTLFVGRKGTGKSANFFKLSDELESDKRNLVVKIKPISYELIGINSLLEKLHGKTSKNYAIETLWKFLLLSEIGNTIVNQIKERDEAEGRASEEELNLVESFEANDGALGKDFAVRLEKLIESIQENSTIFDSERGLEENQNAITEAVHKGIYKNLRITIGKLLSNKKRVIILIDNLDKAWDKNKNLSVVAEFFIGLLSAAGRLTVDFSKDDGRRDSASVTTVVFLRSDIFYKIKSIAREPDKITGHQLSWNDSEILLRVIEERFTSLHAGSLRPGDIWNRYFCETVKGIETKQYFLQSCLPRPRDIVYFVKASIASAVNRKHSKVEENDVIDGEKQYSQFAIESLLVESNTTAFPIESVLYEFVGSTKHLTKEELNEVLQKSEAKSEDISIIIEELCKLRFLGVQVGTNDFRFTDDEQEFKKTKILVQKYESRENLSSKFMINPAYWAFLEVSS